MKKLLFIAGLILLSFAYCKANGKPRTGENIYKNPVINYSLPDPSIIKANDGYFYVYATENIRNLPIHRSKNLVNWEEVGTAFTDKTRPTFEPEGSVWAPDINYINGQYVLYYSMSVWGGEWTCGIGVATSDKPEGPFTDRGVMFRSNSIGVQNSIDPFYIEDNGKKYLLWGSFRGIYGIELSDDGLAIRKNAEKRQVAGTAYEATYIHKRGKYYYLFASIGSCCEGLKSTYTTVVGRSENLFGPYVDKKGQPMMENHHEILIRGNEAFVGTGHNSEIITDNAGKDWMLYHAVSKENPTGRVLMMDQVRWVDDWPEVTGAAPSLEAEAPVFSMQKSELFMELPDDCPTPDGMAIAPNGDLILACPNFANLSKPACLMRITKEGKISKWLEVPVLPETGWAAPMGITFDDEGNLFICDNQGWSGAEKAKNKGRVLCLKLNGNELVETIEVATGMEHPNGIRFRNGKLYVTQSSLSSIEDPSGLLVSGVYCFDKNDRNIQVTNTRKDKNLIATVITKNKEVQYGLDGIVFDKKGNLYVGNFGDGAVHKLTMDKKGNVTGNKVWAHDPAQLRTTDGMCMDDDGNIWVADFSENAVARIDKNGRIRRIAQSPDCDGSNGGLDQPGEPIVWNGQVIISCFDIVTGPDKVNTKHDKPYTLAKLQLE